MNTASPICMTWPWTIETQRWLESRVDLAVLLTSLPIIFALIALLIRSNRARPWLLPLSSATHFAIVLVALRAERVESYDGWLRLDDLGKIFLLTVSGLHLLCMLYAPGYLALRHERSNRVLCACLAATQAVMTLVILSQHMGLMWVAVEASTLISAPGLFFNRGPRSLEATWKYLLVCSVGIALALLGSFFVAYSAIQAGLPSGENTLHFDFLVENASKLSASPCLRAAFVLLFVGYGTKMGLSPMHAWKPDAYGEAPGMVGALLSGGVASCAFLAILRFFRVMGAAGEAAYASRIMLTMGLVSVATAAIFMTRQKDFKRLLAYSSVEHMGIMIFGVGIGGPAIGAALLHVLNNAMTKGVLFLSAGNIHRAYGAKTTIEVRGAIRALPLSGTLLLFGVIAGCGSPPFAPFVSEFAILQEALRSRQFWPAGLFLTALFTIFLGMGATALAVTQGEPSAAGQKTTFPDDFRTGAPIVLCMAVVVALGCYVPPPLWELITSAAQYLRPEPVV